MEMRRQLAKAGSPSNPRTARSRSASRALTFAARAIFTSRKLAWLGNTCRPGNPLRTRAIRSRSAGVSARTLHHYDQVGLLRPALRTPAGYRIYQHADLLRLQQILFYRELDVPLAEIQALLDRPGFDPVRALRDHRQNLQARAARLAQLIETIDRTLSHNTEGTQPM